MGQNIGQNPEHLCLPLSPPQIPSKCQNKYENKNKSLLAAGDQKRWHQGTIRWEMSVLYKRHASTWWQNTGGWKNLYRWRRRLLIKRFLSRSWVTQRLESEGVRRRNLGPENKLQYCQSPFQDSQVKGWFQYKSISTVLYIKKDICSGSLLMGTMGQTEN